MPRFDRHPHGQFGWIDLVSTDQAAAEAFYTSLFGWSVERRPLPMGGHYTMFLQEGLPVAGCGQMSDERKAGGAPSQWNTYVSVEDCAAVEGRVAELGGSVMVPTMDVMEAGRMAFVTAPDGATIGLWQAKQHHGAALCNEPVSLAWSELATRDAAAAKAFFAELLGWSYEDVQMGPGFTYAMISNQGKQIGGILPMTEEWGDLPSHWMTYLAVADLDATTAKLEELGGKRHYGPMEGTPGRWSVVSGPTGEVFSIIQLAR